MNDDEYRVSMAYRFHWVHYKKKCKSFISKVSIHNVLVIISSVTIKFSEKNFVSAYKMCEGAAWFCETRAQSGHGVQPGMSCRTELLRERRTGATLSRAVGAWGLLPGGATVLGLRNRGPGREGNRKVCSRPSPYSW